MAGVLLAMRLNRETATETRGRSKKVRALENKVLTSHALQSVSYYSDIQKAFDMDDLLLD